VTTILYFMKNSVEIVGYSACLLNSTLYLLVEPAKRISNS